MTPRQYLCKMETDRREARRAKQGDVRTGETVECVICGYLAKSLSHHLKNLHGLTPGEYKALHGVKRVIARDQGFVAGSENPAFAHRGALSAWSENFVHGYDATRHAAAKAAHSTHQTGNRKNVFSRAHYASDAQYTLAQTRDLAWFVGRYGEIEGCRRHALKTERWAKSFRKCNFSMISQELFSAIDCRGAYFATKDMPGMEDYKNKEYVFVSDSGTFRLDFFVPDRMIAIEFDGDYWHSNARVNPEREARRELALSAAGITVLRIREQDYKKDKLGTIQKCKEFLTR